MTPHLRDAAMVPPIARTARFPRGNQSLMTLLLNCIPDKELYVGFGVFFLQFASPDGTAPMILSGTFPR